MSHVTMDSNYMYCVVSDIRFRKVLSPESWEVCVGGANGSYDIAFTVGKNVNETDFVGACEPFVKTQQIQKNAEGYAESLPTEPSQ